MGYDANEQPMVSAIIYYYDEETSTSVEFVRKFLYVLGKSGYDAITNIELGKQHLVEGVLKGYIVQYCKKALLPLDLEKELFKWVNDGEITYISFVHKEKGRWVWDVTWHKNCRMPDDICVSDYTFNQLTLASSYECLKTKDAQSEYVGLFCELCDLFAAFYGRIEDVSTAVELLDRTKEKVFNPRRIQTIYWGNYLGERYHKAMRETKNEKIPFDVKRVTERGVFLAVSDDLLDSKDKPDIRKRNRLFKYLSKYKL